MEIKLFNTSSLSKHGAKISKDNRLLHVDIHWLTDQDAMPEQDVNRTNCFNQSHVYHNESTDRFDSLAFAYRHSKDTVSHHKIPRKQFFSFR